MRVAQGTVLCAAEPTHSTVPCADGYVYDKETGLYYLQSRYYDPEVGRFISGDAVISGVGGDLLGCNQFTYCFNNPVNLTDSDGNWPQWFEDALEWAEESIVKAVETVETFVEENIIEPIETFVQEISEDIAAYDSNNQSEDVVLESNHFSNYKGVLVIRTDGNRSGSFGAIFLTRETNERDNPEDVIRHEYGHTRQLAELGVVNYALCIGLPSWRQWGTGQYYSKPFEITADIYGDVQSRVHSQENINKGFAYLNGSKYIGPVIWIFIE